jgi:hypothetical protein
VKVEGAAPPEVDKQLVNGNNIPGEENRDDTKDYIGLMLYETQKGREEGRLDQLPAQPNELTED